MVDKKKIIIIVSSITGTSKSFASIAVTKGNLTFFSYRVSWNAKGVGGGGRCQAEMILDGSNSTIPPLPHKK